MDEQVRRAGGPGMSERALFDDVVEIAERALWNPVHVTANEIQKLAGAVVAHARRFTPANPVRQSDGDGLSRSSDLSP